MGKYRFSAGVQDAGEGQIALAMARDGLNLDWGQSNATAGQPRGRFNYAASTIDAKSISVVCVGSDRRTLAEPVQAKVHHFSGETPGPDAAQKRGPQPIVKNEPLGV